MRKRVHGSGAGEGGVGCGGGGSGGRWFACEKKKGERRGTIKIILFIGFKWVRESKLFSDPNHWVYGVLSLSAIFGGFSGSYGCGSNLVG